MLFDSDFGKIGTQAVKRLSLVSLTLIVIGSEETFLSFSNFNCLHVILNLISPKITNRSKVLAFQGCRNFSEQPLRLKRY